MFNIYIYKYEHSYRDIYIYIYVCNNYIHSSRVRWKHNSNVYGSIDAPGFCGHVGLSLSPSYSLIPLQPKGFSSSLIFLSLSRYVYPLRACNIQPASHPALSRRHKVKKKKKGKDIKRYI